MDNLINIINEEIKNFDFLDIDKRNKEQEINDLLLNEDLQKQFISDSVLGKKEKIKILKTTETRLGGNWDSSNIEDITTLSLQYGILIQYIYDSTKEPLKFNLDFYGDNIPVSVEGKYERGTYMQPEYSENWFTYIDWEKIEVILSDLNNEEVKFVAFEKAPDKIKVLFDKTYLEGFIENTTSISIKDNIN